MIKNHWGGCDLRDREQSGVVSANGRLHFRRSNGYRDEYVLNANDLPIGDDRRSAASRRSTRRVAWMEAAATVEAVSFDGCRRWRPSPRRGDRVRRRQDSRCTADHRRRRPIMRPDCLHLTSSCHHGYASIRVLLLLQLLTMTTTSLSAILRSSTDTFGTSGYRSTAFLSTRSKSVARFLEIGLVK